MNKIVRIGILACCTVSLMAVVARAQEPDKGALDGQASAKALTGRLESLETTAKQDKIRAVEEAKAVATKDADDKLKNMADQIEVLNKNLQGSVTLGLSLVFPWTFQSVPSHQKTGASSLMPYLTWYPGREQVAGPVAVECAALRVGKSTAEAKTTAVAVAAANLRGQAKFASKPMSPDGKPYATMPDDEITSQKHQTDLYGGVFYDPRMQARPKCGNANWGVFVGRPGDFDVEFRDSATPFASVKRTVSGIISAGIVFAPDPKISVLVGGAAVSVPNSVGATDTALAVIIGLGANAEILQLFGAK